MSALVDGIDVIFDKDLLKAGDVYGKSFLMGGCHFRFCQRTDHKYIEFSVMNSKAEAGRVNNSILTGYIPVKSLDEIIVALQRLRPPLKQLEFGDRYDGPGAIETLIANMEKEAAQEKFVLSKPLLQKEIR